MSTEFKIILNKKRLIIIFLILAAFLSGFLLAYLLKAKKLPEFPGITKMGKPASDQKELDQFNSQMSTEKSELPLPTGEKIDGYLKTELVNLDKEPTKELAAIYYHDSGNKIYETFFVIFKRKNGSWEKLLEKQIEGFGLINDSPQEMGEALNQMELVDLTGSGVSDVLVQSRAEGSGSYLGVFVFGLLSVNLPSTSGVDNIDLTG